jgi:pimeloyl-ACP methyl ester carboxylesterase
MELETLRRILKYLVTLLVLLALTHRAMAQQPSTPGVTLGGGHTIPKAKADKGPGPKTIHGTVEDANGNPIENAHVLVRDTKTNVTRTLSTNAAGVYSGNSFPANGSYEVTAEFSGKTSDKKAVSSYLNREDNVLNFQIRQVNVAGAANNSARAAGAPAASPGSVQIDTFDLVKLQAGLEFPIGVPAPVPAVLLLHGFGEDRAVWNDFKKALLEHGFAVMTLDLRGHGGSKTKNNLPIAASPDWRTSPHDFPLDMDAAMTWLKTQTRINSNKIAVIGVDVGANLALIASGKFRQVRTVVAVNPNLREGQEMAGGALDYKPRSALIFTSSEMEGNSIKNGVQTPVQVQVLSQTGGTTSWFQNKQVADSVFQWLKDTF